VAAMPNSLWCRRQPGGFTVSYRLRGRAAPLLVTLTAWRMLIHRAKLRAGETVLVVGAGGGANSMAIQVAKLAGAKVFVVASNAAKQDEP